MPSWHPLPRLCRYYVSAYFLAKCTAEALVYFVTPICFSAIAYWMIGLQASAAGQAARVPRR